MTVHIEAENSAYSRAYVRKWAKINNFSFSEALDSILSSLRGDLDGDPDGTDSETDN